MIRKCYLLLVALTMSMSSRGQHANVQNPVVGLSTGTLIRNGCGSVNTTDTVGDPSVFGINSWNVYAWNSTGYDSWTLNYAGFYVDSNLSMSTLNFWQDDQSPSYASGYTGLPVTDDDHSFSAKRRGFPFDNYRINIPSHDDWAYLLIDGVEVWNHEDCCDYHENVWEGILTDTSTIEFRVMEFGGGSYGVVELIPNALNATATSTLIQCYNGTSDITITATGGFPPYTGTGTFTVSAGTYDYLITDSIGNDFTLSVNVPSPLAADTIIATNNSTTFCDGDSILLTAPSHGQAVSFAGDANRIYIPFDSPETDYTYELDFMTTEPNTGISSVRDGDLGGSHDRNLYLENGQIMHRLYSEEVIGSSNENYADGQWHHVAVVVESGVGQRIYVDGIEVASGYMDHSDFNWDNTINLGFSNEWFNGRIDNVRLWNVVRSQTEIEEDQTLHANSAIAGLIGNWDFDESDGYTTYNSIDNSQATFEEGSSLIPNNSSSYNWSTGETTQSIVARTGGIYTVDVSMSNGCAMNSPSIELQVNPIPAIPSMSTTSPLSFCEGFEAIFSCNDSGNVQWNQNGIPVDGDTISTFKAEEEGNYSVTITNSYGCSQTSSEQFVEVFPAPRAPYIEASGPITFCAGESVNLTAKNEYVNHRWASSVIAVSSEYGSVEWGAIQLLGAPDVYPNYGDIEFSWSPGGWDDPDEYFELGYTHPIPINYIDIYETFGPGTVDSVYVKNPGTGLFELVYSATPQYAGDTATVLHITFPMTAFPVSEIRVSLETAAVEGWNDFDAVGIGNDLPSSYSWSTGDTLATLNVSTSGTYSVSITNSIGCTSSSEPLEITVNPLPVVTVGSDMYTGICSSTFLLSGGIPAGGTYNGIGVSNDEFDPTIGPGSYAIEYSYTDSNGCSNSASNQVTVADAPVTTLNSFQNICSDAAPFTLTGGSPTGGTYFGTGITNGMFDPSIGSGTYQVNYIFEDTYGCSTVASESITVELCLGVEKNSLNHSISYFPNPAADKVNIDFSKMEKLKSLEIYSSTGTKVYVHSFTENIHSHILEIDLSNFSAGSYILRAISEDGIFNSKLMIEK